MRPDGLIVVSPVFDDDPWLFDRVEEFPVEQLVAEGGRDRQAHDLCSTSEIHRTASSIGPKKGGSLLDADYPNIGVNLACRSTGDDCLVSAVNAYQCVGRSQRALRRRMPDCYSISG